jgi:hypothetical protein
MIERTRSESILRASTSQATDPADEARQILGSSGYHALRLLRCEYHEGAIVIHGLVPSFHQKQMAQAVLLASPRITAVINRAEVVQVSLREHAGLPTV